MEPFMEQKVPMCYVRLQDTIRFLAKQLQDDGRPPFFYASEYLWVSICSVIHKQFANLLLKS